MRHKVHGSLQREHRHVEAVRLRGELEVRVHVDRAHPKGVRRQRLDGRVDHVIAEGHVDLPGRGPGHTVPGGDHVAPRNQRTPASGKHRSVFVETGQGGGEGGQTEDSGGDQRERERERENGAG